jgi:hypothetical protein
MFIPPGSERKRYCETVRLVIIEPISFDGRGTAPGAWATFCPRPTVHAERTVVVHPAADALAFASMRTVPARDVAVGLDVAGGAHLGLVGGEVDVVDRQDGAGFVQDAASAQAFDALVTGQHGVLGGQIAGVVDAPAHRRNAAGNRQILASFDRCRIAAPDSGDTP